MVKRLIKTEAEFLALFHFHSVLTKFFHVIRIGAWSLVFGQLRPCLPADPAQPCAGHATEYLLLAASSSACYILKS